MHSHLPLVNVPKPSVVILRPLNGCSRGILEGRCYKNVIARDGPEKTLRAFYQDGFHRAIEYAAGKVSVMSCLT
jgi:hypothetical protein